MQNQFLKNLTVRLTGWFLVLVLLQTPVIVFLSSRWPEYRFIFKAVSEIYLLLLVILCIIVGWFKAVTKSAVMWLALIYGLWQVAIAWFKGGNMIAVASGLLLNLRFIIAMGVIYAVGINNRFIIKSIIKKWWLAAWAVMLFAMAQIIFLPKDFLTNFGYSANTIAPYLMVDQNHNLVRINATLRGPNPLGALCVIMISFLVMKKRGQKTKIGWLSASVVGLVLIWTWSRSAWLAALVVLMAGFMLRMKAIEFKKYTRIISSVVIVIGIIIGYILSQFPNGRTANYVQQIIFHYNPDSVSVSKSNQEHSSSIQLALKQIRQQPLGYGIGATGTPSVYNQKVNIIENYFLAMMVEIGVIGGSFLVALNVGVLGKLYHNRHQYLAGSLLISGIGLLIVNLVLPMWADDAVSYSWWGLVGLSLALINNRGKNNENH